MKLKGWLSRWRRARVASWLNRRIPPSQQLYLNHKNLFILPSRFGWVFLSMAVTLLLLGNNYQNNLILGLGLWLLSLMFICLLLCHRNLSGLTVTAIENAEGFCHQGLELHLVVESTLRGRGLNISSHYPDWRGTQSWRYTAPDLTISLQAPHRGQFPLPRLCLESFYPLGLFRCWTLADFDRQAIAYPKPLSGFACPYMESSSTTDSAQVAPVGANTDPQFAGLVAHQPGASLSRVAWKQLAAGRGWQQKLFIDEGLGVSVLAEQALMHLPREQRLSILADWLVLLTQSQQAVGLVLLHAQLPAGRGSEHLKLALRLLASAPKGDRDA